MTPLIHLSGLFVHPVKSMAIRPLAEATVLRRGLADDRSWIVVDGAGELVSARELPELFALRADTPRTDPLVAAPLRLVAPGGAERLVEIPDGAPVPVQMFGSDLRGVPADPATQAWLRAATGRKDVRLLWCHAPQERLLDPEDSPGDHTAFADCYPVTLASESSLAQLNDWIAQEARERGESPPAAMGIDRFRPNLVVSGAAPFSEDQWRRIRIGDVVMRVVEPAARCVMTTLDPRTLARGKEPIRTLARRRREGSKTLFAIHLVPEGIGSVRLGDEVVVEP